MTFDELDQLVDTDPIKLRDVAWSSHKAFSDLREGLQGLMDSLDDGVISDEKEREGVHRALLSLFENGWN